MEFACSIPFKYITSRSQRKLQIEPWIGPNGGREKKLHWTFQLILIAFTCDILTSPSKLNRLYSCGNEDNYSLCSCPGCFLPRNKKQPRCIWFTPDKPTNCVRQVWLTCETVSRDNIYNTVTSAGPPLQRNTPLVICSHLLLEIITLSHYCRKCAVRIQTLHQSLPLTLKLNEPLNWSWMETSRPCRRLETSHTCLKHKGWVGYLLLFTEDR